MSHPFTNAHEAHVPFEQPFVVTYIEECLTDLNKNVFSGMYCLILGHALNKLPFQEALDNAYRQQAGLFGEHALSSAQSQGLAFAMQEQKVAPAKCAICRAVFLNDAAKSHEHCFEHRQPSP